MHALVGCAVLFGKVFADGACGSMITGFNQDVSYKGTVYHVQTEDRGKGNPLIETLIYVGGEIVASRRTSYEDLDERWLQRGQGRGSA